MVPVRTPLRLTEPSPTSTLWALPGRLVSTSCATCDSGLGVVTDNGFSDDTGRVSGHFAFQLPSSVQDRESVLWGMGDLREIPKRLRWPIAVVSATALRRVEGKTHRLIEALRGLCATCGRAPVISYAGVIHPSSAPPCILPNLRLTHPPAPHVPCPSLFPLVGPEPEPSLGLARLAQPISRNPPSPPK